MNEKKKNVVEKDKLPEHLRTAVRLSKEDAANLKGLAEKTKERIAEAEKNQEQPEMFEELKENLRVLNMAMELKEGKKKLTPGEIETIFNEIGTNLGNKMREAAKKKLKKEEEPEESPQELNQAVTEMFKGLLSKEEEKPAANEGELVGQPGQNLWSDELIRLGFKPEDYAIITKTKKNGKEFYEFWKTNEEGKGKEFIAGRFSGEPIKVKRQIILSQEEMDSLLDGLKDGEPEEEIAKPLIIKPGEKIERMERSRAAADYTLNRVENTDELHADTEPEGHEKFARKMKQLWNKFATHGLLYTDKETGKTVLKSHSHLDEKTAIGLLKLAGFDTSDLQFVEPGEYVEGRVNLGTGNVHGFKEGENDTAFIGDHGSESGKDASTSKFAYEILVDLGFLKQEKHLDTLVNFVTEEDNKEYHNSELKRNFKNSWGTVLGLYRYLSFEQLADFFEKGGNPETILSKSQLEKYGLTRRSEDRKRLIKVSLSKLEKMEKRGLIINSDRYGKIAVDIGKKIELGYDAARAYGCGGYLIWNPKTQSFFFSTVKPIEDSFSQGMKIREKMWIKPQNDKNKLTVTLKEILEKVTDGKLRAEGKLKEALEEEPKEDVDALLKNFGEEKEELDVRELFAIEKYYEEIVGDQLEGIPEYYNDPKNKYTQGEIETGIKLETGKFWREDVAEIIREETDANYMIRESMIDEAVKRIKEKFNIKE